MVLHHSSFKRVGFITDHANGFLIHWWSSEEGICSVTPKRRKTSCGEDSDNDYCEKASSIDRELSKRLSGDSTDSLGVPRIYGIRRSRRVSSVSILFLRLPLVRAL